MYIRTQNETFYYDTWYCFPGKSTGPPGPAKTGLGLS